MSKNHIIGDAIPNLPWQDRPKGSSALVWRHSNNPVIGRNPAPGVARVFNSAVAPWEGRYVGIFRGDAVNGRPCLYLGFSGDGLIWDIDPDRIRFQDEEGKPYQPSYA